MMSVLTVRHSLLWYLLLSSVSSFTLFSHAKGKLISTRRFLSDQWDDEESIPTVTSYDDAASTLMKQKEEKDLMDQSDRAVPGSESEAQEALRNAVKARTTALGIETASQDALKEAEQRAAQRSGSGRTSFAGLDLSKISDGGYEKLSINYDPEDEMTEEEMRQADPLGYQPVLEQYLFELKETTFPDLTTTISKVGLLIVLGIVTGFLILNTDRIVRNFYVSQGMLPSPEDVSAAQRSGMDLAKQLIQETTNPGTVSSALPDIGP